MNNVEKYLMEHKVTYTPMVVGYLIEGDNVILGLRKKVSNDLGPDLYVGIGGKIEEGETAEEAFKREVLEEIGVEVIDFQLKGNVKFIFPNKPSWCGDVDIFICTKWSGEPIETEAIKPEVINKNNLPWENMWEDNQLWIPKILRGEEVNMAILYSEEGKFVDSYLEL